MPLTKKGKKRLSEFKKRYGKRGREVFYRYMNKYPKRTKKWYKLGQKKN